MKKILLSCAFALLVCCVATLPCFAETQTPASQSFNGLLPDGTSIWGNDATNGTAEVSPAVILGYKYVEGYESLSGFQYVYDYKYLYGTSISYVGGASPTYTLTVNVTKSSSSTWNLNGDISGEGDIKALKAKLRFFGGYGETETVTISAGQSWSCGFNQPGTYNLTWYARGHSYYAFCGAILISTDMNDGNFEDKHLVGQVVFPTQEIHFDVSRG